MGTPQPKKQFQIPLSRLTMQNQVCVFQWREDRHSSQGEEKCFHFTNQSALHAFLTGSLLMQHMRPLAEKYEHVLFHWFHVERPQLHPRNRETQNPEN